MPCVDLLLCDLSDFKKEINDHNKNSDDTNLMSMVDYIGILAK